MIERICQWCGKKFMVKPYKVKIGKGKFHSRECFHKWLKEHLKGKPRPEELVQRIAEKRRGIPLSEEHKKKISKANKGKHLTAEHKEKIRKGNLGRHGSMKGQHHTEKVKKRISEKMRGSNSYRWQGGITSTQMAIIHSYPFRHWRQQILFRDNFTCQECGVVGGKLHVHHKNKTFKQLLKEIEENMPLLDVYDGAMVYAPMWDIDNGVTLCAKCHHKKHRR
jgi:hypothetical protein